MTAAAPAGCPTLVTMAARTLPPALESTRAVQVPLRRLRAAEERLEDARLNYHATRRQAVAELHAQGLSYAQIAELIGVTRGRAYQIARGD